MSTTQAVPNCASICSIGYYRGLSKTNVHRMFVNVTVTIEDGKMYLYSITTRRRVYKFQDIKVSLHNLNGTPRASNGTRGFSIY